MLLHINKVIPLNSNIYCVLTEFNLITYNNTSIVFILYIFHRLQKEIMSNKSLTLLKLKALKLQLKVVILNFQKLINKKEVNPISSQPKIMVKKLLPLIKKIIDKINQFISKTNSSFRSSYLK